MPARCLVELARLCPQTEEALASIKGLGPIRRERHGRTLLEVLQRLEEEDSLRRTEAEPSRHRGVVVDAQITEAIGVLREAEDQPVRD